MIIAFHGLKLLVVTNQHPVIAKVVTEGVRDLVVQEGQKAAAWVDQVHLDPQTAENRGVFTANDAGTVDCQGPRCM